LKTRREFSDLINRSRYKFVAEVGVGWGGYSKFLLNNCPGIILYSIDPWTGAEFRPGSKEHVYDLLKVFGDRSKILDLTSKDAATQFKDNTFDFIYIDGDHCEAAVKLDLESWWPKLRIGGTLAGHDYSIGSVKTVVDDFAKMMNIKIQVTGMEPTYCSDFGEEAQCSSWWFEKY
jgi:predicted O-methyltransferase YrrM